MISLNIVEHCNALSELISPVESQMIDFIVLNSFGLMKLF